MLCLRSLAQALPPMAQIPRASLATSAFLNFSKVGQAKKVPSQCCLQGQQVSAAEKSGDQGRSGSKVGSIWRLPQYSGLGHVSWQNWALSSIINFLYQVVWPNHTDFYTHKKHRKHQAWHTHGVQKQSLMNVVDNSNLGRRAMAEGRPPKVSTWKLPKLSELN